MALRNDRQVLCKKYHQLLLVPRRDLMVIMKAERNSGFEPMRRGSRRALTGGPQPQP
jgi:hypothetical protein